MQSLISNKTGKKYFLILLLLTLVMPLFGQMYSWERFIEYEKVISELEADPNRESVISKYDFAFILLLDSTRVELVEEFSPESVEYFREYAPSLSINNSTVGFNTWKKDIKRNI